MLQINLSSMIKLTHKISNSIIYLLLNYFLFHHKLILQRGPIPRLNFIARAFDWRIIIGSLQFGDSSEIPLKAPNEIFIQSNAIYRNYRLWRTQLFLRQRSRWTEFFPAEISPGAPMSLSVLTIFALPNIFLAPRAHQVLLLRRLAFLCGGGTFIKTPVNSAVRRSRETPTTGRGLRFIQCYSTA